MTRHAGMTRRSKNGSLLSKSSPSINRASSTSASLERRKFWDKCGHKRKTNRESARISQAFGLLSESDLLLLTLAIQLRCLARPFIGSVRANPVAAPAAPVEEKWAFSFIPHRERVGDEVDDLSGANR